MIRLFMTSVSFLSSFCYIIIINIIIIVIIVIIIILIALLQIAFFLGVALDEILNLIVKNIVRAPRPSPGNYQICHHEC